MPNETESPPSSITLTTIDGVQLVGEVMTAHSSQPIRGGVVLAHPHPLFGGDRLNPVIDALFRTLPKHGFHTLRFDFRGAGESFGEHDNGDAERLDIAAGIDFLSQMDDHGVWVCGYSFGSVVGLNVVEPRVIGWIAVAPPLAALPNSTRVLASGDPRQKLLLIGEHDQFSTPSQIVHTTGEWINSHQETINGVDHFLLGRTQWVADHVAQWLKNAEQS